MEIKLMEGVEILTQHIHSTELKTIVEFACSLIGFLCLVFGIMSLVDTLKEPNKHTQKSFGTISAVLLGVTAACIAFLINIECGNLMPNEYVEEYQVTIDENVSMTEFMEKYEIIKQDGKIYTIIAKESK